MMGFTILICSAAFEWGKNVWRVTQTGRTGELNSDESTEIDLNANLALGYRCLKMKATV